MDLRIRRIARRCRPWNSAVRLHAMPAGRALRAVAGIAAATLLGGAGPGAGADRPRIALFEAPGFPTVDAPPIPAEVLAEALEELPVARFGSPADLADD